MNAKEKAIRERAYQLWDQAGRPEGRSQEFCNCSPPPLVGLSGGESEM